MKNNYRNLAVCLPLLAALSTPALAAEEIIETDDRFDAGRVQMNATLTGTRLGQWAGAAANNASNVGWNEQGIWYSFVRFGGTDTQGEDLATIHQKMQDAEQIHLRTDVYWYELASGFPGDKGVDVSVYFVPQLVVPEGSLPTTQNTWPFIYPHAEKVAVIPRTTEPLRPENVNQSFEPPYDPETDVLDLLVDLTEPIQSAIAEGTLEADTPWGIVFFPEEMEDQLDTPNNPAWIDKRQTVMLGGYEVLVLSDESAGDTWFGYPVDPDGWVDTDGWLNFVNVSAEPWVYSASLSKYIYVGDDSGWTYVPGN